MEMDMELINRTSSAPADAALLSPATDASSPLPMAPREFPATATPTPGALKKRPFPSSPAAVAPLPLPLSMAPLEAGAEPSTEAPAVATCNFSALSHHFHLPLKVAAEKFGVRATAFKKRCRAIGIRHWPYRKVRSLKRSLQELAECKAQAENGSGPPLTDKQLRQQAVYQAQLSRLLSPETYGIDPSGQLLPHNFFALDGGATPSTPGDDDDSDDDSCGSQSPRVHPSPAAIHHHRLAALGAAGARKNKARKHFFADSPSAVPHESLFFYNPVAATSAAIFDSGFLATGTVSADMPPSSSLNTHAALGFDALYDPFGAMDDFVGNDHPSCGYSLDSVSYDFFPLHPSPTMATRKAAVAASAASSANSTATSASSSSSTTPAADGLEDDIFRHISPEYGCLV